MDIEHFVSREKIHNLEVYMGDLEHLQLVGHDCVNVSYDILNALQDIKILGEQESELRIKRHDLEMMVRTEMGTSSRAFYGSKEIAYFKEVDIKPKIARVYRKLVVK